MKSLFANDIRGNWATVLLPIKPNESIDYIRLKDDLEVIISADVNGIYTNGTAGEFLTQTENEFEKICRIVAGECEKNDIPFQIGASHTSPQIMLERVRIAKEFKPGAIQVILPDWLPVTNEEAIVFLSKVAEIAEPIGIVLYNPPHAKRVLSPADFGEIKQKVPNLVGLKVMDGDMNWYAEMRKFAGDLSIFVPGHHLATGITQGAAGSYSNVACLNPHGAQKWFEMMQTDIDEALKLEQRIQEFFRQFILPFRTEHNYSNAALDKFLAAIGGWSTAGTRLRFPYRWIPESHVIKQSSVVQTFIPELFNR